MSKRPFSAASYRTLGSQEAIPFELSDGTSVKIPRPDAAVMFDVEEGQRLGTMGPRDILRRLCGDVGDDIITEVSSWPIEGVNAFTQDLMEQLGLGESAASSG